MNQKQVWKRVTAMGAALVLSLSLAGTQAFAADAAAAPPELMGLQPVYAEAEALHGPMLLQADYDPTTATGALGTYGFDTAKDAYTLYVLGGEVELQAVAFGDGKLTWSVDSESGGAVKFTTDDGDKNEITANSAESYIDSAVTVKFDDSVVTDKDATIHVQCATTDTAAKGTDYTIVLVRADKTGAALPQVNVELESAIGGGVPAHVSVENAQFTTMSFSLEIDTTSGALSGFSDAEGTVPFNYNTANYVWADVLNNKVLVGASMKAPDSNTATAATPAPGTDGDAGWTIYSMGGKPVFAVSDEVALTSVTYTPAAADGTVSKLTVSMSAKPGDGGAVGTTFVDCTASQELFRLYIGLAEGKSSDDLTLDTDLKAEVDDHNNSITALYYNVFKQSSVRGHDLVTFTLPKLTQFTARLNANSSILANKNPTYTVLRLDGDSKADTDGTIYQDVAITNNSIAFKLPAGTYRVEFQADGCLPQVGYIVTDADKDIHARVGQILPLYLGKVDTAAANSYQIGLSDRSALLKYFNYTEAMMNDITEDTEKANAKLCDLDGDKLVSSWDLGVLLQNLGAASKAEAPADGKFDTTKGDFVIDLSK